jgi:hypothetical protein
MPRDVLNDLKCRNALPPPLGNKRNLLSDGDRLYLSQRILAA